MVILKTFSCDAGRRAAGPPACRGQLALAVVANWHAQALAGQLALAVTAN